MSTTAEVQEKVEAFVQHLGLSSEAIADHLWILRDTSRGLNHIVVIATNDLVIVRVKVMEIPEKERLPFFEDLLRLNLEMLHGAYALEDDSLIWMDTLEFPTMDVEEFQATLDAAAAHLRDHTPRLARYSPGGIDGIL
jgi:hypothetical protein